MFYKHIILKVNDISTLYLFLTNIYEFSNEYNVMNKEKLYNKINNYIETNNLVFDNKKIFLVINDIIIGSILSKNMKTFSINKYIDIPDNIEIIDVYNELQNH